MSSTAVKSMAEQKHAQKLSSTAVTCILVENGGLVLQLITKNSPCKVKSKETGALILSPFR